MTQPAVPDTSHHPLRVVLVVSNLEFGGAQRQVAHLAAGLDPERFEVHLCSLSTYVPLAGEQLRSPDRLHTIAKRWKYDFTVITRLSALLRRLQADVVNGFLFDAQVAARLAGCLARVTLVVDSERNSHYRISPVQRMVFRLTRRCVHRVIANSQAGAEYHRSQFGHPLEQYRVVHNGVDIDRYRPGSAAQVRRELGIPEDALVIGMFASFKPQKNHPLFLESAARLRKEFPNLRCLLVGDELSGAMKGTGDHKRHVTELLERLRLRSSCVAAGNRSDVERLYPACDMTVLPSFYEGTPNVVLESMACGVPVVASEVGDVARILPDGQAGFLVPPDDEPALTARLGELARDPTLRTRFGQEARRWVASSFSLARLASATADVYEQGWRERVRALGPRNHRDGAEHRPSQDGRS